MPGMRVIAGIARGRPLRAPRNSPTRPTADYIKGAIFSMLEAEAYKRGFEPDQEGNLASGIAWPRVLDIFAGSGALGIEALSRGASHANFIEQDAEAIRTIRANLQATGFLDQSTLYHQSVTTALARIRRPLDAVFLDPPYQDQELLDVALDALARGDFLRPESVVIVEQSASATPPPAVGLLPLRGTRTHSQTRISLYAQQVTDRRVAHGGEL
jgi:16S rRNA (guanine966-N2)-methyltransferase